MQNSGLEIVAGLTRPLRETEEFLTSPKILCLNPNAQKSYKNFCLNLNAQKSYKNYLQNTSHVVLCNRPTLSIATKKITSLNNSHDVQLGTLT